MRLDQGNRLVWEEAQDAGDPLPQVWAEILPHNSEEMFRLRSGSDLDDQAVLVADEEAQPRRTSEVEADQFTVITGVSAVALPGMKLRIVIHAYPGAHEYEKSGGAGFLPCCPLEVNRLPFHWGARLEHHEGLLPYGRGEEAHVVLFPRRGEDRHSRL